MQNPESGNIDVVIADLAWAARINRALGVLLDPIMAPDATLEEVSDKLLKEARDIVGCGDGYAGSIDQESYALVVHAVTEMVGGQCRLAPKGRNIKFFPGKNGWYNGLWGHSLNTHEPFVTNEPGKHEASAGAPEGHVPIVNVLSYPVVAAGELMGQISLANKPGGFVKRDLEAVGQLGRLFAIAIRRIRDLKKKQETEERYRDLVELMQEGIIIDDAESRITYVNHMLCSMLGVSRKDLVGRSLHDFVIPEDRARWKRAQDDRKRGGTGNYELVMRNADGAKVFTLISPTPMFNEDGKFIGSFGVVTDVTRLKLLESQLLQAQKLESIGQLAAGIAHEINTPTQYVDNNVRYLETTFLDMLKMAETARELADAVSRGDDVAALKRIAWGVPDQEFLDELREDVPEALSDSLKGLERIAEIVASIKRLSHPGQTEKKYVNINDSVKSTITVATNEWKYVAEMQTELADDLPDVPCLIGEFNQVLLNLIVNAVDAIKDRIGEAPSERGMISVETAAVDGGVEVRVSDTGIGIPADIRGRIFDPFFTTKEVGKGTGQGLAISYSVIVEKHGGRISVESEEGKGSTFVVFLPAGTDDG
ncbi:ATP-binding protein [Pseudodesulfovibrio tunisiensis]|uniref:ATP-binding protein n=1 Tax=Pseudodesulfovibrio tunisiensis TaxID=463192 RepID=UPI001FB21E6C|nr:ATP-binding protein [Pseudodesulfovibrio tunisiensis]